MKKQIKLKKGALLWWKRTGNSSNQNINCPCVVTKVNKTGFRVRTFDDFVESDTILRSSVAFKEEMKKASKPNVEAFLEMKQESIQTRVALAKKELHEALELLSWFDISTEKVGFCPRK